MAIEIEPARGLYWYAAHASDALPEESERAAGLARSHLTDRCMSVAGGAVEVYGGIVRSQLSRQPERASRLAGG